MAVPFHRALFVALLIAALFGSGCAGVSRRQRLTRTMVVVGAVVGVAGGMLAAGCVPDGVPGPCTAGPDDGTVRYGVPIMAVGAALIAAGLLVRPPSARPGGANVTRHAAPNSGDPFGPPPLQGY